MQLNLPTPEPATPARTCCFTGHRRIPEAHIEALYRLTDEAILTLYKEGVRTFRTGGALGFDTIAALRVLRMKAVDLPDIRLHLILPCREQSSKWSKSDIEQYNVILGCADAVTYTSEHYISGCMQIRNHALLKNSDYCVAYLTGSTGGTAYTVTKAFRDDIPVINLAEYIPLSNKEQ